MMMMVKMMKMTMMKVLVVMIVFLQVVQTFSRSLSCNLECEDLTDLQVEHLKQLPKAKCLLKHLKCSLHRRKQNVKRSIAKSLRRKMIMTTIGDS